MEALVSLPGEFPVDLGECFGAYDRDVWVRSFQLVDGESGYDFSAWSGWRAEATFRGERVVFDVDASRAAEGVFTLTVPSGVEFMRGGAATWSWDIQGISPVGEETIAKGKVVWAKGVTE